MLHEKEIYHAPDAVVISTSDRKLIQSMPIVINEDSDDESLLESSNKSSRCLSLPIYLNKSILKRKTLDESLHSTYGSEDGIISGRSRKHMSLQFDKVSIREYSRIVGDNPSCSSGPPVR